MLFEPEFPSPKSTTKYDHRLEETRDKAMMRDQSDRAILIRWVAAQIDEQGLDPAWVAILLRPL